MHKVRPQVVLLVETTAGGDAAAKVLQASELVDKVEVRNGQAVVTLKPGTSDYTELPTALIAAGQRIKMFREEEINLETAFMMLTKGLGKRV
jgi:ABC-2 type transport system ATP-binding protein